MTRSWLKNALGRQGDMSSSGGFDISHKWHEGSSFWVSSSAECGHSGGFVGAGGKPEHGVRAGVDVGGSCGV